VVKDLARTDAGVLSVASTGPFATVVRAVPISSPRSEIDGDALLLPVAKAGGA
jgi:hypothetical protein